MAALRLHHWARAAVPSIIVAAVSACASGPDYRRPADPAPLDYLEPRTRAAIDASGVIVAADVPARWWERFRCAELDRLVRRALDRNPTVEAAQAALRAAAENRRAQQSAFTPTVGASYGVTRQKLAGATASGASSNASLYNLHTAQVDVSYVPDLFGANRRQVESLRALEDQQRWSREATALTLSANVVVAAMTEAGLRAQIDATGKLIELETDTLERFRRLEIAGQNSHLDVVQQEALLATTRSTLPPLRKQLALQRDELKTLVGAAPDESIATFELEALTLPRPLPLTLPSTLADRRPDVLMAESQVRAASAAIGVAAAARLPSVTLGVNAWGSMAYTIRELFAPGSTFWTLGASIAQSVFDGGVLRHREEAARANYDQALATYRATLGTAYQGIADVLQAIELDGAALVDAEQSRDAAAATLKITRRQLEIGDANVLALIAAQQSVLQSSLSLAQARTNQLSDAAALFQALGGGWWNHTTGDPVE